MHITYANYKHADYENPTKLNVMRDIKKFKANEWLRLLPIGYALRLLRNNVWQAIYRQIRPENLQRFLEETRRYEGKNIALVIAFEQPWVLDWLLRMSKRNLTDATVLVFDNSRRASARLEIEGVCRKQGISYLALPANPTRHVNRSHGMAMTWIYYNVVKSIEPRLFAFLDHDMIPVEEISLEKSLARQPFYGYVRVNPWAWNLWAGYCMYDFKAVEGKPLNFLYDFSRKLDTGGLNWDCLYKYYDWRQMHLAGSEFIHLRDPVNGKPKLMQIVDHDWLHIQGIGYNDNFSAKAQFCQHLASAFDKGISMASIIERNIS